MRFFWGRVRARPGRPRSSIDLASAGLYLAGVPKPPRKRKARAPARPAPSAVIPLSHWRAALARARTSRRASALLELPDAERVVPGLPVQDLYYAIKEIGLDDAHELLALTSPIQVRGFLDLDLWDRDHIQAPRLTEWWDALLELELPLMVAAVRALDVELPSLWLARQARVYDLSLGEAPPEDTQSPLLATPDHFFLVEITAAGEAARTCERLLDALYRGDPDLARRVVQGAHWELPSELEEASYRWRSGRMADLGFVDYYDALEIYRPLDPHSVAIGENSAQEVEARSPVDAPGSQSLPAPYAEPLGADSFFHRAMARLDDPAQLVRVQHALVALANRVMAADGVDPAQLDAVRAALERALGTLSIGLEYVAGGDLGRAVDGLRTVALVRLFRVGASLLGQLRKLAETLSRSGRGRLEPPWDAFLVALRGRLPRLHAPGFREPRWFQSVADIRLAAGLLEQVRWQSTLVLDRLGFAHPQASLGDLVRTAAANLALGRPFAPTPLTRADLQALRDSAFGPGGGLAQALRARVLAAIGERAPDAPPYLDALVDGWLARLSDELGHVTGTPDTRFVGGLLIESRN